MSHAVTVRARARHGRTVLAAVRAGAGLVLTAVVLLTAPAAGAHDYLVTTDPADGAVLDSSPDSLTLTFSDELLEVAPAVILSDAAGDVMVQGEPDLRGAVADLPVGDVLAPGEYTVAWSVVSGDGHRIQGSYGFAVGGGEPTTDTASATATATASEEPAAATPDASTPGDAEATDDNDLLLPGWLTGVLGVAAVASLAVAVVLAVRRSRGAQGES